MDCWELVLKHKKALMGFAALWICFFHCWNPIFNRTFLEFPELYIKRIGFCGVDIFFFLSGMTLVYSVEKNTIGRYYYNRIKRVLLPYFLITVAIALFEKWSVTSFIQNITGYSFYRIGINTYLWFYTAIIQLYILFPWYYKLFSKNKNKKIFLVILLCVWYLLSMLVSDKLRGDLWAITNRIPIFLIGSYFGWKSKHEQIIYQKDHTVLFLALLSVGLSMAYLCNYRDYFLLVPVSNCCVPNILISISLCVLLAAIVEKTYQKRFAKWIFTVTEFFGMISLELYSVQERIWEQLNPFLIRNGICALYRNGFLIVCISLAGYLLYLTTRLITGLLPK